MKGQTFVEVLVALGLIGVVATAIAGLVVISMGNTRHSKDQNMATQYSQEGMEIIRQKRDSDYIAFRNIATGTYCLDLGSSILKQDCITANVGNFIRKVIITQDGCFANVTKVIVVVSWQDSKCPARNIFCHTSQMESCFSSINPIPTL
ncbi:hypothetical protein KJ980_00640 [Patescibacteria group bacterium]|nr:hypothetical protein [Patescibacteria group bacterium]MBU4098136.1 hypothetical protein [Patescibacteria group bacterium]